MTGAKLLTTGPTICGTSSTIVVAPIVSRNIFPILQFVRTLTTSFTIKFMAIGLLNGLNPCRTLLVSNPTWPMFGTPLTTVLISIVTGFTHVDALRGTVTFLSLKKPWALWVN